MKKILCATDFSLRSELAIDRALAMARQFGAELTLLHVVDDDLPRPMVDRRSDEAHAALAARAKAMQARSGITATVEIRRGTVFMAIAEAARFSKADLLVMGGTQATLRERCPHRYDPRARPAHRTSSHTDGQCRDLGQV